MPKARTSHCTTPAPCDRPTLNFLVSVRKTLGPETLSSSWRWLFSHNLPPSESTWLLSLSFPKGKCIFLSQTTISTSRGALLTQVFLARLEVADCIPLTCTPPAVVPRQSPVISVSELAGCVALQNLCSTPERMGQNCFVDKTRGLNNGSPDYWFPINKRRKIYSNALFLQPFSLHPTFPTCLFPLSFFECISFEKHSSTNIMGICLTSKDSSIMLQRPILWVECGI